VARRAQRQIDRPATTQRRSNVGERSCAQNVRRRALQTHRILSVKNAIKQNGPQHCLARRLARPERHLFEEQ